MFTVQGAGGQEEKLVEGARALEVGLNQIDLWSVRSTCGS